MRYKAPSTFLAVTLLTGIASAQSMKPHPGGHAPANDAMNSNDVETAKTPARGANSFTEAQARSRIATAGYTHISALAKDKDGLWQGTASLHGHKKHVALDYKGNVSSR